MGKGCGRNPYFNDAATDAAESPHGAGREMATAAERCRSAVGPPQAATLAGPPPEKHSAEQPKVMSAQK